MKKSAYKFHEKILMGVYFLSLGGAIATAVMSEDGELHQSINLCIWITSTIMWSHIYITLRHKRDNMIEAADVPASTVGQKALASAPSALNTYEKGIYEEGFKDGVNYLKNELNNNL
jgi:hypothetical protein